MAENPLPKIFYENPFTRENELIQEAKKSTVEFYSCLSSPAEEIDLPILQIEAITEIQKIFSDEISKFEEKIEKTISIKKRAEILFLTKERYYQKILQKLAMYLSLECGGNINNISNLKLKKIKNVIEMGFREIISVMENDLPLYDKLFTELDSIRDTDKKIELYIGRDGVYAYEGRRAIDVARRRKKTKEEKNQRKLLVIHPRYVNYNSFIKKNFDEETRLKYLHDQGVNDSQDLIIFDTGYRGSIPEQILRSIGFSKEEIEKRIKILGTDYYQNPEVSFEEDKDEKTKIRNRVVRGVSNTIENYNRVARIEERPKRFMTSTGLYKNKEGKLMPIEPPFLDEISFHYDLIELTIRQYYFNREYFEKKSEQ